MRSFSKLLLILIFPLVCQAAMELPIATVQKDEIILNHKYFVVSYDQNYRLANYVQYILTKSHLQKKIATRKPFFTADPLLVANGIPYNTTNDIKLSRDGYVKGHLAPATDFRYDQKASDLANVMSNVGPQDEVLNDTSWLKLEDNVRKWACGEQRLAVITGPILRKNLKQLISGVAVPKNYFKAIADLTPPIKTMAFVYSQNDTSSTPQKQVLSVSELEKVIGYELFPFIKDKKILSSYDIESWKSEKCFQ
jgi:endonuclease G